MPPQVDDRFLDREVMDRLRVRRGMLFQKYCTDTGIPSCGKGNINPYSLKGIAKRMGLSHLAVRNWFDDQAYPQGLERWSNLCRVLETSFEVEVLAVIDEALGETKRRR